MPDFAADIREGFVARYGLEPDVVARAPGRINLIGEHTDYTGGLVLPVAIDAFVDAAVRIRSDDVLRVCSHAMPEMPELCLPILPDADVQPDWVRYIVGVVMLLRKHLGKAFGADLYLNADLPPGAGLASSAALEVAVALACTTSLRRRIARLRLAELCRRAEHQYARSPCGVMDQIICACARRDSALLIDCGAIRTRQVPLRLPDAALLVVDTGVRHRIAGEAYAARRTEAAAAMRLAESFDTSITCSSDVTEDVVCRAMNVEAAGHYSTASDRPACIAGMGGALSVPVRRLLHLSSENARVRAAVKALRADDLSTLGALMYASHRSLREDYEVSCEELDTVVVEAARMKEVWGARMTGGGFGGSVIVLVRAVAADDMAARLRRGFAARFGYSPHCRRVRAVAGAEVLYRKSDHHAAPAN